MGPDGPGPKWDPNGPGPNGAQMVRDPNGPGQNGTQMVRAQMAQDGPGPDGPRWPRPRWAKMARAQIGQDGLGPDGPRWGPGGSGFVEEWPSHKGSCGTHKGKWIPRPWQTLWMCPNPPNPPWKNNFPGNPHFPRSPLGPGLAPMAAPCEPSGFFFCNTGMARFSTLAAGF